MKIKVSVVANQQQRILGVVSYVQEPKDKEEGGNNFKQVILFTFIGITYQVDN